MTKPTKEDLGYDEGLWGMFLQINPQIPNGSFQLQKRKESYYWYYILGTDGEDGKKRLKYICSTFEGKNKEGNT